MLTRLKVTNYQSISEADLALGALNVIVGPGNLGKSALLRALSALIFNQTGADFIRKGTTHCQVMVELEGRRIIWDKDAKGGASYAQEGIGDVTDHQEYRKLAGAVPEELTALLGIRSIDIDKGFSVAPQIHDQYDQPLLLMESAGKVARALAQMTKLAVLVEAQVASARDLRRAKQDVGRYDQIIEGLKTHLAALVDTTDVERLAKEIAAALLRAQDTYNGLQEATELWRLYQAAQARREVELPRREDLDRLDAALSDLEEAAHAVQGRHDAKEQLTLLRREQESLQATLDRYEKLLADALGSLTVCPLCGTVLGDR
jgi:energy-coupling factor transporter ATP-binding protein EcfA2